MRPVMVGALLLLVASPLAAQSTASCPLPRAATGPQVDTLHGTPVADPYRWLENTDAAETHTLGHRLRPT